MLLGSLRRIGLVLLLLLPAVLFYWAHYHPKDARLIPTGFVQYDQPYYMANARQYVDGRTDGWRYALPNSPSENAAAIYFQPQTLLLAGLMRVTQADPGALFVAFGAVSAVICLLLGLLVLDRLTGHAVPLPVAIVFVWGGGLLALAGFTYGVLHGTDWRTAALGAFRFDPGNGWWFMNLGRNLIFPLEAFYHALFFGLLLLLHGKRLWMAAMVAALLALAHPFTGAAALLLLLAWGVHEQFMRSERLVGVAWVLAIAVMLALLLVWHGLVLPRDAEHRSLMQQWKQPWLVEAHSWMPAYAIVGSMAAWRLRSRNRIKLFLALPMNRLLAIWVLVFLALENHELVMEPIQPAHFTRGYAWLALFLIGAPVLIEAWQRVNGKALHLFAGAIFMGVMLLDNASWFALRMAESRNGVGENIWLTADQAALYEWLEHELPQEELLVAEEPMVAYLAMTYTHHRAWYSHFANTPDAERRLKAQQVYFSGGEVDTDLRCEHIAIVLDAAPYPGSSPAVRIFSNECFAVYRVSPRRAES